MDTTSINNNVNSAAGSDTQVELSSELTPEKLPVNELQCEVLSLEMVNADVYRVRLQTPHSDGSPPLFYAGQYLELLLSGRKVPFSIASAPEQGGEIELHILRNEANQTSLDVIEYLGREKQVTVNLPKGGCHLQAGQLEQGKHLILIAASTGFSQVKSMVEHALHVGVDNPIHIFWGVRQPHNFYLLDLVEDWVKQHDSVSFTPVVSERIEGGAWGGEHGLVHEAVLKNYDSLDNSRIYVCGSPGMVYAVEDAFKEEGMQDGQMFSDVFSYAPRP